MLTGCYRCIRKAHSTRLCNLKPSRIIKRHSSSDVLPELGSALLGRAQRLSDQHRQLLIQAQDDVEFSNETAARQRKISELAPIQETFEKWKTLQSTRTELLEILNTSKDADMRSLAQEELDTTSTEIVEMAKSLEEVLMPRHPQSHLPALMELRAGIGGDEANIFTNDLLKMYERFAASKRWQVRPYSVSRTEIGDGVTEAIFAISGPDAFGKLRGEAGVHRVQRTPATETKGRTHTSTVSINVLPEIEDPSSSSSGDGGEAEVIDMSEIKLEVMRSRGAGGQHVNRTESAVRLTHVPTGLTISMQDSRSQHANKRAAFAILRSKLTALRRERESEVQVGLRRSQVTSADRSEKIRTFNFAQSRVTDHRCGYTSHDLEGILNGTQSLEDLLDAVSRWTAGEELKVVMANEPQYQQDNDENVAIEGGKS